MTIGGLVVSLVADAAGRRAACERMERDPRLTLGPGHGDRIAVVVETATAGEGRDLCEALVLDPGIRDVQIAWLGEEDDPWEDLRPEAAGREGEEVLG